MQREESDFNHAKRTKDIFRDDRSSLLRLIGAICTVHFISMLRVMML
jgi:NO-binding membrane sensor protein with MHYT domain